MGVVTRYETIYKTRKEHKCYSCGLTIPVGSCCTHGVAIDSDINNGQFTADYFCGACRDVMRNEPRKSKEVNHAL